MKKFLIIWTLIAIPSVASAVAVTNFATLVDWAANAIAVLAYLIISLAVLVFMWGVFKYLASGGDEEARKTGRTYIVWGIVSIAVIISVWGLVRILANSFGLTNVGRTQVIPDGYGGSYPGGVPNVGGL